MKSSFSRLTIRLASKPEVEEPVDIVNGTFEVEANVVAPLLGVSASDLPQLIREKEVTTAVERGEGDDAGTYRLTFFYRQCRARLVINDSGSIRKRSAIDFGERQCAKRGTS